MWGPCLPLVSREWKSDSNSSYNCTPFFHSLLTKGRLSNLVLGYGIVGIVELLCGTLNNTVCNCIPRLLN